MHFFLFCTRKYIWLSLATVPDNCSFDLAVSPCLRMTSTAQMSWKWNYLRAKAKRADRNFAKVGQTTTKSQHVNI